MICLIVLIHPSIPSLCSIRRPLCSFISVALFCSLSLSCNASITSRMCLFLLSPHRLLSTPHLFPPPDFSPYASASPLCLSFRAFMDITAVRTFSNFCFPSPVDLTFHQTKQIALMVSANKELRVTALIRTQWHEREMQGCSIR